MDTAELCKEIERDYKTFEDIEHGLAYVAIKDAHGFNELRPRVVPSKHSSLVAYERLSEGDKLRFMQANPSFFRSEGDGGRYYEGRIFATMTTERNLEWLETMKKIFEKDGNVPFAQKCQDRIYDFKDVPTNAFEPSMVGNTNWTE